MTPQELLTLKDLGTFSGLVIAVTLIVQFVKRDLDRLVKLRTRYVVLLLAWSLLLLLRYINGQSFAAGPLLLDFINGFLVALAAMGTHQVAKDNSWCG